MLAIGHGFAPPRTLHLHTLSTPISSSSSSSSLSMFTGIIEEMGDVLELETKDDMILWDGSKGSGTEMLIKGNIVMDGAYLGCSISVNGVCLTATELDFDNNTFKVGLAPETLRKTNLGTYIPNSQKKVNLERASEIGGRNSGHFVQGHIDNVGTIIDRWVDENSLFFKISFPYEFMRYVVTKGFIAIDGTSLTVCDVKSGGPDGENWFTFMLVEYTQQKIIIPSKQIGDTVNIEVDVLGKYSEQSWGAFAPTMEALEQRVKELEAKVEQLEAGGSGEGIAADAAGKKEVTMGESIPSSRSSISPQDLTAKSINFRNNPEGWVRAKQEFTNADGNDLDPKRKNVNNKGTNWVRTEQTFYDSNY